jgi:hypothetical protein
MRQKLSDVPEGLVKMFGMLLSNDNPDKHETILVLQFVLFTRRPLKPEGLYFAMIAGTNPENLEAWNRLKITADIIRRRITTSSRGLTETRKGQGETVQFIHESVNDFLLGNRRLETLDPTINLDAIGTRHDCLRACCMSYLMMSEQPLAKEKSRVDELSFDYPFLEYASTYVLGHAEVTHCLQQQHENFERLGRFHNAFERIPGLGCDKAATPLYKLSFHGCHELVRIVLFEEQADVNAQGGPYGNALQAASADGKEEDVRILLENGADVNAQGGFCGNAHQEESIDVDCKDDWGRTPLLWAGKSGHKAIVQLLLESSKVEADSKHGISRTPLSYAAERHEAVVRLLQLTPPLDISSLAENLKRAPKEPSTSNVSSLCLTSSNFIPASSDAVWQVVSPTFLEPNYWICKTIPVTQQRPRKRYVYVWQCVSGCLMHAKSQRSLN